MKTLAERCVANAGVRSNGVLDLTRRARRPSRGKRFQRTLNLCITQVQYDGLRELADRGRGSISDLARGAIDGFLAGK